MPVLETVRNISFLSTVLELYSEIALSRKSFGIGHMNKYIYIYFFLNGRYYDLQNIDSSSWDIPYTTINANLRFPAALREKPKTDRESTVFWDVALCRLAEIYGCFGRMCCFLLQCLHSKASKQQPIRTKAETGCVQVKL
jgi:hypothetical protein